MTAPDPARAPRTTPDAIALPRDWASHQPAVRRALIVVLIINLGVVSAKLAVGWATGSLTVLGAALESGLDLVNLILGITLVSVAARAPDEDHPYGHDKFETLGTLAIVGFLSISCFELLRQAVGQVVHRVAPLRPSLADVGVLALTALA